MSQENVDRLLKSTEAFNRGDVEGWLEASHPDVVEVRLGELEGDYSGHDGLRRFFAEFAESFEMVELHFPDVRDLGDRVLALGTMRTIGRESGIENEVSVAFVASFLEGLCIHLKDYRDWGQALEAVGLSD
jgi:ketosteroid isomerase-like protein